MTKDQHEFIARRSANAGPFHITVLPLLIAQEFKPVAPKVIMISIADTSGDVPMFCFPEAYAGILRLTFDDIEQEYPAKGVELMTEAQAEQIAEFVIKYANEETRLIIHCTAGVCRSAAVASAICDFYGAVKAQQLFFDSDIFFANRHVYFLVKNALNKRCS